ncbi:MAG TPA: imidazole glycerol phosphate synthase subunit HisH [Rhodospirillales bacterium]|nr:imidazole glycerol phosphate synthase subunit HisH [Rhodospirillales bacterium]
MAGAKPRIAIVDYGLGNLFSIGQACEHAGMAVAITSNTDEMNAADAVLLPGVGAFADAMAALGERGLIQPLKDMANGGKPLIGICLGLQLLMTRSYEFGTHDGLGLIKGDVRRLPENHMKVPHVGWNRIRRPSGASWEGTVLDGIDGDSYMYFVHSYNVAPEDAGVVFSLSSYGDHEFCSSVRQGNIFACQFHPERSASQGLRIYHNMTRLLSQEGSK